MDLWGQVVLCIQCVDELWIWTYDGHYVDGSLLDRLDCTVCLNGNIMYELHLPGEVMMTGARM